MRLNAQSLGYHFYDCERMFRLDVANLLLGSILPTTYRTSDGDITNNVEGLCIVLRRLAFPARWYDLVSVFGRQEGSLSRIFITTMYKIMAFWGHLLQFDPRRLQHRLQEWAAAIAAHPAGIDPLLCIALFIDGTLRGTTRPHPANLPPGVTYDMLQQVVSWLETPREYGSQWHHCRTLRPSCWLPQRLRNAEAIRRNCVALFAKRWWCGVSNLWRWGIP